MNHAPSFHVFARHLRGAHIPTSKSALLTAERESELVAQMRGTGGEGPRRRAHAREQLILAYLPLARRMAHNAAVRGVVPRDDLESEACIALTMAIDKFDPERGTRISTLASIDIKSALMHYVMNNSGPTRLGTNLDDKRVFMNLRAKIREIESREGRPVQDKDLDAIAEDLGVKLTAVKRMMPRIFASDTTISGTDTVAEDDNGTILGGRGGMAYIATAGGQEEREVAMDLSRIVRVMEDVTSARWSGRNREIIMAYVRGPCSKKKLDELAEKYNISVERVRQIQREGRDTLRQHLQTVAKIRSVSDISL